MNREQPGRSRLLSLVLCVVACAAISGCPEKSGAQTSGDAARDARNQTGDPQQGNQQIDWSTALQTGTPPSGHGDYCQIDEYIPQYATGSLGRTVEVLREIYDQQLCVNEDNYGRRLRTQTGADTIYVPCQNWNDCYDEKGNRVAGKCNYETADLLLQLTPQVPACVRSRALVKAYHRSAELPDKAHVDDQINGLVYRRDGHILFSSEFFAWDSRIPGRYNLQQPADQKRFAEASERNFVGTKALRNCQLKIDYNDPEAATRQPEVEADFAAKVSRGRALFHEYIHGVTQQQRTEGKNDPVPQFAGLTPGFSYMNMPLDDLVKRGVLTSAEANELAGRYGERVQSVSELSISARRESFRAEDGRFFESVEVTLRHVQRSKQITPQLVVDVLNADIGLLRHQMKVAVEKGQQREWLRLHQRYCAAITERARLLRSLDFSARHANDTHSSEDTEENFAIAVEMAVYDPQGFESQFSNEQKQFVRDWWARSFDCDLADVQRWVKEVS